MLKGSLTRDFRSQFFSHDSVPPRPASSPLGPFWIFSKIRGDIRELIFIIGVNDTGEKLVSGVNDTGDKFIIDTGDQLSAVTTTPAINLSPVTRTRTPWRWGAAKDRRKLKGINRRHLRPPKSAHGRRSRPTAADDVIGTAMKSCIHTHPTHLDQRPLRPPKLNNAVLVCSSFGGLRGLRAC